MQTLFHSLFWQTRDSEESVSAAPASQPQPAAPTAVEEEEEIPEFSKSQKDKVGPVFFSFYIF